MAITQLNHLGEIACRRWLEAAPGSEERAVNEERVAEYLDSPLTRRIIDDEFGARRSGSIITGVFDRLDQIGNTGFLRIVIDGRTGCREIDRTVFDARLPFELSFDAIGARRARHARDR